MRVGACACLCTLRFLFSLFFVHLYSLQNGHSVGSLSTKPTAATATAAHARAQGTRQPRTASSFMTLTSVSSSSSIASCTRTHLVSSPGTSKLHFFSRAYATVLFGFSYSSSLTLLTPHSQLSSLFTLPSSPPHCCIPSSLSSLFPIPLFCFSFLSRGFVLSWLTSPFGCSLCVFFRMCLGGKVQRKRKILTMSQSKKITTTITTM